MRSRRSVSALAIVALLAGTVVTTAGQELLCQILQNVGRNAVRAGKA